ncbi:MAG: hypothetical protein QGH83_08060 [Candidatus Pacebacteria bacterium]|jgi:hypothetical protein|nr:hypothetical protein [Candidatus Paceibacterota bacterium]
MIRFKNFISEGLIKVPQKIYKKFEKSLLEFAFSHMVAEVDLDYVDAIKKVARKNGVRSFKKPQKEVRVKYKRPDVEIPVRKSDDYMDIDPVDNLHLFMVFNEKEVVHNADYDTDHDVTGESTITVYVSNYVRDIRDVNDVDQAGFTASQIVTKLKADLRHEMMHFVQDIYLANKHEKQNQQNPQSGKENRTKREIDKDNINYFTSQQEFDPTIQSEIGEFISTSSFQPSLQKHIAKSDFFRILKKHQPKKYKIAVRKFTVGVNQYLKARKKK